MKNIPDTIISINRSSGVEPIFSKIYISKIKHMNEKYPTTVCVECLQEAHDDTITHKGYTPKWSSFYSCYIDTCQICGEEAECTEPRDAGYPIFDYVIQRIRAKKVKKLINKIK